MPKENHTGILCTKRNLPCIHPPTVTVDKKQKQVTQVLPHPSTSHCKHLHGTGVSQCLTTCSVIQTGICAASHPPGQESSRQTLGNRTLLLQTLHSTATNEDGKGINLPGDLELLSSHTKTALPMASRGFTLFLLHPPWKSWLAPRSPNKPKQVPQQLRLTKLTADDDKHSGL